MSLADKITMLMSRPGGDNAQKDDVPWWMRYAGRGLGTVGSFSAYYGKLKFLKTLAKHLELASGKALFLNNRVDLALLTIIVAIILGLMNCLGIILLDVSCLIAGIWQMLAGFIVIVCEAPCCCFFIDYVQTLSDKVETRPYWNKAALYIGLALPPFFLCFLSMSTWFGSGLIFATGIIYGMMALGKKASVDDMRTSAANLEAGQPTTAPRASLVTNEQPFSISGPPAY